MKFSKAWGVIAAAAPLVIISFVVSVKLGVVALLAALIVARLLRGSSNSGGLIGVDHQGQAHGRPHDEGNGGVGRPTFPSPWHGRP